VPPGIARTLSHSFRGSRHRRFLGTAQVNELIGPGGTGGGADVWRSRPLTSPAVGRAVSAALVLIRLRWGNCWTEQFLEGRP